GALAETFQSRTRRDRSHQRHRYGVGSAPGRERAGPDRVRRDQLTQLHSKQVCRVLRKAYARAPLDGEGAYLFGGRWSSVGTRLAYTSEHQSLAMLEYFVHFDAADAPPDLVLVTAEVPDDLPTQRAAVAELPQNWRRS